jgi:mevalonate kinase
VTVRSSNPVGYGLGSSAAFSVALLRALCAATGRCLSQEELNTHAFALEQHVHGRPSGIDNTVVSHCRAVAFRRGEEPRFIDPTHRPRLVLARSSEPGATRDAVARVAGIARRDPTRLAQLCDEAREVAVAGQTALLRGAWPRLGALMNQAHALLQEIDVSTAELDRLVAAARAAGALGAKLTGAGRGGFVVALVSADTEASVERGLAAAGAAEVIIEHSTGELTNGARPGGGT